LPRLQASFDKHSIDYINIYDSFKASSQTLYYTSDSHWNCTGKQFWIDQINNALQKKATTKKM
jgi:hypothetical protein